MPYKRGAPPGNKNRLKHGRYTARRLEHRRRVVVTLRDVRHALLAARLELAAFDCRGLRKDTPPRENRVDR